MPVQRDVDGVALLRPLLDVSRAQTAAACTALGLRPWHDPHNLDPSFTRVRARSLLADLSSALGPAVVSNLARTASMVAADNAALDALAAAFLDGLSLPDLGAAELAALMPAVRTRVLREWARSLGAPGSALSHRHIDALDALVTDWHGQGPVALPGAILVRRRDGVLRPVGATTDLAGW
jgi:tRNA(Ile)-lysidine synthase